MGSLSMDLATESKVADIKGSTATDAPSKKSEMYIVCFCVCPHITRHETRLDQGEWW